ncbi:MAG: ABC transporter ATP-binding protein [Bacillota bacterium]|nr:ABC transporter ATP-binding protein [Bacillota bacterium]
MKSFWLLKDFFRNNVWRYVLGVLWLIIVNSAQLVIPYLLGYITDQVETGQVASSDLWRFAGYIMAIAILIVASRYLWRIYIMGTARKLEFHLRDMLFIHLQKLSANFYNEHKTGDLMAHATNDVNAVRMALGPGIIMLTDAIFLTIATVIIMSQTIDTRLTALALLPLPFMAMLVMFAGRIIHVRFKAVQAAFSNMTDRVQENLSGIRVIKTFVQEDSEAKRFDEVARNLIFRNMDLVRVWGLFMPLVQFISGLSYLIVLAYGGTLVIEGTITLGAFVAFNTYLAMLIWPMMALGWVINVLQRGASSMERLKVLLETEPEIVDRPDVKEVKRLNGDLEIRNLHFSYPDGTEVLKDINIILHRGNTLAIIGRTGSGKSTLANLLLRLYDPPDGRIFIDNTDINQIPLEVLHRDIGYVPQDLFLFSTTLHENIAFADESYSREQVEEAARLAQIYDNIIEFPQKFDTISGERGVTLSGGQKQRMTIARALIKNPALLILDDCLSAVDTETEEKILKELHRFMSGRSTIIISHRVSTVQDADEIVILDQGRIIEKGTHEELLKADGFYRQLHHKQQLERLIAEDRG